MTEAIVLNSWKEISQYMGRSVRTLQRWEHFGLPIHRPSGRDKSSVYALPYELNQWLAKGKPNEPPVEEFQDRLRAITDHARDVVDSVAVLQKNAASLQTSIAKSMELRAKLLEQRNGRQFRRSA
jgi:phage terminase Nu1 subunit (DNA packaging protein)